MAEDAPVEVRTEECLPAPVGIVSPVALSERFREIAAAAQIAPELLASYVCEEWGTRHSPGDELLLVVDRRSATGA